MKHNIKSNSIFQIMIGVLITAIASTIYIGQLNKSVENSTMNTINELALHDKRSIEAFIDTCWNELEGIAERFSVYNCKTISEIETRMELECSTSGFSHIYLLAEDGKIYTDKHVVYNSEQNERNENVNLLPYFENDQKKVVVRWDDKAIETGVSKEYILYGITLNNFKVDNIKMRALIGLSETNMIQEHVVLDSFVKNGVRRGYSAIVNRSGDYVIGISNVLYANEGHNLYSDLNTSSHVELSNKEIEKKLNASECFDFSYTDAYGVSKLLYLMPFDNNINWYFMLVVENQVFIEQSQRFILLSISLLITIIFVVIVIMLALMSSHNKSVQIAAKAKAQGEFLSNMSHEIRTPLNGLIGLNHLIRSHIDEKDKIDQIKDWLNKSHSTANYLLSLVNDVLDVSKLQAGKADIIYEPIMVEMIIDAIWSMQRDNIESRDIHFIIEKDIPFPCIISDGTRIKQVLMNIVGNAAKFTPKNGSITLSVTQKKIDDTHVETIYCCTDTGIGMNEEFLSKIFDAFSQERNKNSESVKGTGLGMAISKLIVDTMGGKITVQSELNVGTTFTVTLPSEIAESEPNYTEQCTEQTIAEGNMIANTLHTGRPIKILLAEDNALNAEILLDILTEEGFEVVHAENGKEAVEIFLNSQINEFDTILMDMQMPIMDGCTASLKIRSQNRPDAKTILIFACTANTFKEDRDLATESGMNDFLAKPIDVNILLKKLRAIK